MSTVLSIGARLAGGGIGDRAYHIALALSKAGYLGRLYASSSRANDLPPALVRSMGGLGRAIRYLTFRFHSYRANAIHDYLFDRWVAMQLPPCELFHGWTLFSLHSLARAKQLGAMTLLDRGMTHPLNYSEVLDREFARWGMNKRFYEGRLRRALGELDRADYVLVGSEYAHSTYVEHGYPAERLFTVPYGVDTERYRPAPEPPRGPFRVLYMGQISLGKGIPYLLQAWKSLGWTDAELWLVGNVSPEVRQAVGPLLALPGVHTPGFVRDPVAAYQSADVFCIPTLAEGSAKVTFEAMACGLPMITTVEAGSMARHECEALICPAADARALADALQRLRDDVALRETLGHAARLRIENYTWASYGQRLVDVYRQLLPDLAS